jgi:hypothetical protein
VKFLAVRRGSLITHLECCVDVLSLIIIFIVFNVCHLQASPRARVSSFPFYPWCFSLAGCLLPFVQSSLELVSSSPFE